MCDETVADSDVILDSNVSIPATKYQEIVRTVNSQDIKLKAMRNLHQIIQSKDQELKARCEKVQNLQAALDKAEMRLANQIRLTVSGAHQSTLEADSVGQNVALPAEQYLDRPLSQTTSTIRPATDKLQQSSASSSDLEEDCACDPVPESRRTVADHSQKLTSPYHREHVQNSKTWNRESPSVNVRSGDSPALQSRGVKLSPPSFESVGKVESLAGLDSMEKVSLSGSQSLKSIGSTGFSRDLLDKLMQQNARLKKVIRDILHQKGTSFEDYLDRQESQDVITQLRDDLRLTKAQNERLKDVINSRDSADISKKYSELSENFQKLKRTATMMHAMADSYSKEYEKLKVENKDLKDELSTANKKSRSLESRQLKELSNGGTTLTMSAGAEGTISMSLYETLKSHCDEVSMKLISAEAEVEALRLQLQQQLLNEEVQRKTADEMRKQCENLSTEKDLLKTQLTVFQEDFTVEERKHADKRQQLESSIAKHQDWIRKLVAEAQKSRSLFEEEKGKRERAETAKGEVEKRFHSFITQSRSASSNCGSEENWQRGGYHRHAYQEDLQVDNGGDSSSPSMPPPSFRLESQLSNEAAFEREQSGPLVCPRCEREFEARDEQKWRDHCARCTDD